jgi:putative SOS response-associated peptidase YedK
MTFAMLVSSSIEMKMKPLAMPCDYDEWLDRTDTECPPVDLLKPYQADMMESYRVDPRIGSVSNDDLSQCKPWDCPPPSSVTCKSRITGLRSQ